jgi:hypothetical protein
MSASGGLGGVHVYSIESGALKLGFRFHDPGHFDVIFSSDGNFVAAIGDMILVFDLRRMCAIFSCFTLEPFAPAMAFHPKSNNLYSVIGTKVQFIWGPDTSNNISPEPRGLTSRENDTPIDEKLPGLGPRRGESEYRTVNFSHNGRIIATTYSGVIRVLSLDSQQVEAFMVNLVSKC